MTTQDFATAKKELNTAYEVDGKQVVLTAKNRDREKKGAHTYFDGTINGVSFSGKDITAVKNLISGEQKTERKPRKTAAAPAHSHRLETAENLAAAAVSEYTTAAAKVRELECKYGFAQSDNQVLLECKAMHTAERDAAALNKLRATFDRLKSMRAAQLRARENVLVDANKALTAAALSGDVAKITAAALSVQTAAAAVDAFKQRVYLWEC